MRNDHLRWVGIGCALLAAVLTVLVVLEWPPLLGLDRQVARDLHAHAVTHPGVTRLMVVLTDWFWDPWTMRALAALACAWLWLRGDRERAWRVGLATLAAGVVNQGLKALVGRERPVWPDPVHSSNYASYPSGHAMTAAVVCGLLLWLLPRKADRARSTNAWAVAAWVVAVVSVAGVGFTRLYLGVHWLSDVIGGWLLGVVLVALAVCLPARRPRFVAARR
ncbi:phosphatase PAP2 family protein [Streptomyces sp. NPDC059072]|uniref:phosphatase PAP2 family protein n=1 Tax=Streptomyces sp. NPDC059072 TaxID=3346715 RepID=UPI00369ECA3D